MRRSLSIPVAMLLFGVTACNRAGTERSYAVVGDSVAAVRAAFNADAGKVRVLIGGLADLRRLSCRAPLKSLNRSPGSTREKLFRSTCCGCHGEVGAKKMSPLRRASWQTTRRTSSGTAKIFWASNTSKCSGGGVMRGTFTCSMDRGTLERRRPRPRTSSCTRPRRKVRNSMRTSSEKE